MGKVADVADPTQVKAAYRWLADGTKAGVTGYDANGDPASGFEYLGSLVYQRSPDGLQLESAGFGGGRIIVLQTGDGTAYTPNFFLTDHLGSTRVVFNGSGTPERSNYHSFGLRWSEDGAAAINRYLYNGKEQQLTGGMDCLDYGARQYNPITGRWQVLDPLARKYYGISPFAYCGNNPIKFVDPNGKEIVLVTYSSYEFRNSYAATREFTRERGSDGVTRALESHPGRVYIQENRSGPSYYDTKSQTIHWNPEGGIRTTNKKEFSPATVLLHEEDHALRHLTDPSQMQKDLQPNSDPQYGNKEEKRVITGTEQNAALLHGEIKPGEVTRTDHSGQPYTTKGPTTTEDVNTIVIIIPKTPRSSASVTPSTPNVPPNSNEPWRYKPLPYAR